MKDTGWAVLVVLAVIALCCSPEWLFYLMFLVFGLWYLTKGKRYTDLGRRPPSPSEMIQDVFVGEKKNRRRKR